MLATGIPEYLDLDLGCFFAASFRLLSAQKTKGTSSCFLRENSKQKQNHCWSENQNKLCPMNQGFTFMLNEREPFLALFIVQAALFLLIKALSKANFKSSDSTKYHLLAKLPLGIFLKKE